MIVIDPAVTLQVRGNDKVLEPYKCCDDGWNPPKNSGAI